MPYTRYPERRSDSGFGFWLSSDSDSERAGALQRQLVCAQHGRDENGVQFLCRKSRYENEETTL